LSPLAGRRILRMNGAGIKDDGLREALARLGARIIDKAKSKG
jgi:hypothetical protein